MSELRVLATVNLAGLHVGQLALVDPRDPYIAELISAGYLLPQDPPMPAAPTQEEAE